MVVQYIIKCLRKYVPFVVRVFHNKQEVEVVRLFFEFVEGLRYNTHNVTNIWDILNERHLASKLNH